MHEMYVKRTIWVAKCECGCGYERHVDNNPPRESLAPCGNWVEYKESSYLGPSLSQQNNERRR